MRDGLPKFKALKLYGMAGACADLTANDSKTSFESVRWLMAHLLDAEGTDRALRTIRYQMHAAKFPVHRDLAGFDFASSIIDHRLIAQLADRQFTDTAQNVVFVGGTGTGKTHLATAIGTAGVTRHKKRARRTGSGLPFFTVSRAAFRPCL